MRALILSALLLGAVLSGAAQARLTEESIVKDSTGFVYPVDLWKPLVIKGRVRLEAVDPRDPNSEFRIYPLTEAEMEERFRKMPKPRESSYFTTGQKISNFRSTDLSGKKVDLKSLQGKIVVLNFWFVNCGPCRMEIPDLNKLVDSLGGDKVVFLAVALDNRDALQDFLKTSPFRYHIIDNGRYIADLYGIRSYPTHVVLNPEGKVSFHTTGLAPNTVFWLKKSITELLAQQENKTASN